MALRASPYMHHAWRSWGMHARRPGMEWCRFCRKDVEMKPLSDGYCKCVLCGACFKDHGFTDDDAFGKYSGYDDGAPTDSGQDWGSAPRAERTLTEQQLLANTLRDTSVFEMVSGSASAFRTLEIRTFRDAHRMEDESVERENQVQMLARKLRQGCEEIRSAAVALVGGTYKPKVTSTAIDYWVTLVQFLNKVSHTQLYKPQQWTAACLYLAGFQPNPDDGYGFLLSELVERFDIANEKHLCRSIRRLNKFLQKAPDYKYRAPSKSSMCGVYMRRIAVHHNIAVRVRLEAVRILDAFCALRAMSFETDPDPNTSGDGRTRSSDVAPPTASGAAPYTQGLCRFPSSMFKMPMRIACACLSLAFAVKRRDLAKKTKQTTPLQLVTQEQMEHCLGLTESSVSRVCSMMATALRQPLSTYHKLDYWDPRVDFEQEIDHGVAASTEFVDSDADDGEDDGL